MDKPHRRFELDIHIGGDTFDDVLHDLAELADHIPQHGVKCSSVMGGPSCGHTVTITERPDMTHDRYFADLKAHLAKNKSTPADAGEGER